MKRFFWYKVRYYDVGLDEDVETSGVVCAASLTDATKRLTSVGEGYGTTVDRIELQDLADTILDESELKMFFPKQN